MSQAAVQNEIEIATREEFFYLKERGYEPLTGYLAKIKTRIVIPNQLRRELQQEQFKTIESFYRFCFAISPQFCEETGQKLQYYSAAFVSHILSRGAHPAIAKDPRNVNVLSKPQHDVWEFGLRKTMKIWPSNELKTEQLKIEYYGH